MLTPSVKSGIPTVTVTRESDEKSGKPGKVTLTQILTDSSSLPTVYLSSEKLTTGGVEE